MIDENSLIKNSNGCCKKCGKKLNSKISQKRGYGPNCYKKYLEEQNKNSGIKKLF